MSSLGKVAIVTGAGTGIGKSAALALLEEGYAVALAGRRAELLEAVVAEAGLAAPRALAVPTDVSDPESVRAPGHEISIRQVEPVRIVQPVKRRRRLV